MAVSKREPGWLRTLPALGAGIGFRAPYLADLFLPGGSIDFLEITADHYMDASRQKLQELEILAEAFTLIPHGLNLSPGSAEELDEDYLGRLADLVNRLNPPWWSDHLAFTRAGGVEIGHLAPVPRTREMLRYVCRNIEIARTRIKAPLILENITYTVEMPGAEMSEGEFLTEVVKRSDVGLLLDVTNLHTNAVNHGFDARQFLDGLPAESVVQLHFAGGHWENGTLVDSHSRPTTPEVWDLMQEVLARFPVRGVILERDEDLPPFGELVAEVARARDLGRAFGRWV